MIFGQEGTEWDGRVFYEIGLWVDRQETRDFKKIIVFVKFF